jgi:hypothetical protein
VQLISLFRIKINKLQNQRAKIRLEREIDIKNRGVMTLNLRQQLGDLNGRDRVINKISPFQEKTNDERIGPWSTNERIMKFSTRMGSGGLYWRGRRKLGIITPLKCKMNSQKYSLEIKLCSDSINKTKKLIKLYLPLEIVWNIFKLYLIERR